MSKPDLSVKVTPKKYALGGGLIRPRSSPLQASDPRLIEMEPKARIATLDARVRELEGGLQAIAEYIGEAVCQQDICKPCGTSRMIAALLSPATATGVAGVICDMCLRNDCSHTTNANQREGGK